MEVKCPNCENIQKQKPLKSWNYGKMIITRTVEGTQWGPSINCSRYECKCGKSFNYFNSLKSSWTIPKHHE